MKLEEIVLVEEKSKRELQASFSYYLKIKVSDDTARYPVSTEVKFGSLPVIEMNKPKETRRWTSNLNGSLWATYKRLRFCIASALSMVLTRCSFIEIMVTWQFRRYADSAE